MPDALRREPLAASRSCARRDVKRQHGAGKICLKPGAYRTDPEGGSKPLKARRLIAIVGVGMVAGIGPLASSPAQQPGPAGGPGLYIRVPHAAGGVYVPLDSSGRPMAPAPEPAPPSSPGSPGSPAVPAAPGAADWASVTIEVEVSAARVLVDGRDVAPPGGPAGGTLLLVLAPGRHRIEILHAGSTLLSADIEVSAGRAYLIRWPGVPGGGGAVDDARRGGAYQVVPRP